jgi:hypothetical protein
MSTPDQSYRKTQVKHTGTWRDIQKVALKHDGVWKTVHYIWAKHGGQWRKVHRTVIGKYAVIRSLEYNGNTSATNSGTYTVPDKVRYIRVRAKAQGGGGGAAAGTGGAGHWDGHYGCSGGSTNQAGGFHNHVAGGGNGGAGGYLDFKIEVSPNDTFSWSITKSNIAHIPSARLELPTNTAGGSIVGAGSHATGASGLDGGGQVTFSGTTASGTYHFGPGDGGGTAIAYPGAGGGGGKVQVSSNCTSGGGSGEPWGYEVAETNGSNGSNGNVSFANTWIVEDNSNVAGGGHSGGTGAADSYPEGNGDSATDIAWLKIAEYGYF